MKKCYSTAMAALFLVASILLCVSAILEQYVLSDISAGVISVCIAFWSTRSLFAHLGKYFQLNAAIAAEKLVLVDHVLLEYDESTLDEDTRTRIERMQQESVDAIVPVVFLAIVSVPSLLISLCFVFGVIYAVCGSY